MPGETKREIRPYSCISRRWRSMNIDARRTTSQRASLSIEASSQRRTDIRGLAIALSSCQSQVLCPTRKSCLRQTSKTRRRNDLSYNKVTSRLKWRRDSGDVSLYRCRSIASITGLEQVSKPHNLLPRYFCYNSHNLIEGFS